MPNHDTQDRGRSASDVAEQCPLSDEGRALLSPETSPDKYVALLISQKKYVDALRFTAFHFPKREAVWWGALCLWEVCRTKGEEATAKPIGVIFQSVITWLRDPSEANRQALDAAARDIGIATPQGQLAMGAFYSEGSMSLPGQPEVAPEPWLTAKHVASVVVAASKMGKPSEVVERQRLFLVLAAELTKGQLPWNVDNKTAHAVSTP